MRFYKNDADAEGGNDNRASHRLLLAEWRDGMDPDAKALAGNSVHPEFRDHVPGLVARAGFTARHMRGSAQDAIRQLADIAAYHAANATTPHIPPADREAWGQSGEALKALADRAEARLKAQAA